jgi:isoleucyl-tRNA synthetase
MKLQHPFYAREVPVVLGDHVTADAGTGRRSTPHPGHGQEDFAVGQKYWHRAAEPGRPATARSCPRPSSSAGSTSGRRTTRSSRRLTENRVLLASGTLEHSYPHCWRHKTPVAFRVTPQWFISMEQAKLREHAIAAIHRTRWCPDWGEERIAGMVQNRPDWCISRQRTWGVPIALFIDKQSASRTRVPAN